MEGGTTLTIRGSSFSTDVTDVSIAVGGVPCTVIETSHTVIRCVLGRASPRLLPSASPTSDGHAIQYRHEEPHAGLRGATLRSRGKLILELSQMMCGNVVCFFQVVLSMVVVVLIMV